ncbi:MAG: hypothetical protein N4A49_10330 [Marinifilaceae bacterium]|jgi:hypothetical protein|nr:hypothetical protein [Marinifilaceae bacterium]
MKSLTILNSIIYGLTSSLIIISGFFENGIFMINFIIGCFLWLITIFILLKGKSSHILKTNITPYTREEDIQALKKFIFYEKTLYVIIFIFGIIIFSGVCSRVIGEQMSVFG